VPVAIVRQALRCGPIRATDGCAILLEDRPDMSCHVWINLVLSDIIDYAERNDLPEVGRTLRQTAAEVAPLLETEEPATAPADGFDVFPLDVRRAVAGHAPRRADAAAPPLRRVI